MQKTGVFFVFYLILCFVVNSTQLHRATSAEYCTHIWDDFLHNVLVYDRTKKMASSMEDTIKKIQHSARKFKDNKRDMDKKLSGEDLRQYEQLVIKKKYPYLDLNELELKFSPLPNKNIRQSFKFNTDVNFRSDNFLEPDEGMNVEISNRGLSGFTIPPKTVKSVASVHKA